MSITLPSYTTTWTHGGTTATLKIFAVSPFRPNGLTTRISAGSPANGNYYKSVACTVANGILTIPATSIYSTTDALPNTATYNAWLYDSNGIKRELFLGNFAASPNHTSWTQIFAYNDTSYIARPSLNFYNSDQVDELFLTAPANGVSTTDTRLLTDLSDYGNSLQGAIDSIGQTPTVLTITESTPVESDVIFPATLTLDFQGNGIFNIDDRVTATIGSMKDPGSKQVFSGDGSVVFAKGAVKEMNLAWLVGADATTPSAEQVQTAINTLIASANSAQGGTIYIPAGFWETTGEHVLSDSTVIKGAGQFTNSSLRGTTLTLKSGDYLFKIGEGEFATYFQDILLSGTAGTGVKFQGAEPNTSGTFGFDRATIEGFNIGVDINSTSGLWQTAQMQFNNCIFQANATGLKTNSSNQGITLLNTNFAVPAAGLAWDCQLGGLVNFIGCEFAGAGYGTGSKIAVVSGSHGGINFIGCQDEGFDAFLQNDVSDLSALTNFIGCLIQSKILLNQTCKVNIGSGCNIMSYAIAGAATGATVNISEGCYIRAKSVEDGVTIVNPPTPLKTGSLVRILTENLSDNNVFVQRIPQKFVSPSVLDGSPTTPVLSVLSATGVSEDKVQLRIGRMSSAEAPDFYYDIYRKYSDGMLYFVGNQTDPFKGYNFNAGVYVPTLAYSGVWDGLLTVPTCDAVYDAVEALRAAKQNVDAELTAIAGLTSAADKVPYFTGSGTAAVADFTSAGRALVDDASAAAQLVTLGLNIKRVSANVTNATATMANITDLSITLGAGKKYTGEAVFKCSDSTAAEGISFDFDGGTATMTSFAAGAGVLTGGTTVAVTTVSTAIATDLNYTTITGETWITVKLSFVVNAGGTFIPRFCQGTAHTSGTATVSLGSYLRLEETP